jgi:4-hydroxyphenylpyruvate dioxygenase
MAIESLGIKKLEALHYYVRDLDRSRRFYTEQLDFAEIGQSDPSKDDETRQRSLALSAADCTVICSQPLGEGGRAARWLRKHPDGVGTVVFEVEDIAKTFALLDGRGGTPITDVEWFEDDGGKLGTFSITTPFGSSTFRFVERRGFSRLFPSLIPHGEPRGGTNAFGFTHFDHVTSNFETMSPALLWLEHVMGFEEYWGIEFHTEDVAKGGESGSGLRSKVFADPVSGVKFANNEPLRPFFKSSQINIFHEDMKGDGIQHAAIAVTDIISAVRGLKDRAVRFFPTPGSYYDMLPKRIDDLGIERIDEDQAVLRELEILVDGKGAGKYLLQIFLQDSASTHADIQAGPFFYEIIQRKGDKGFGGGNFRALFESIERQQKSEGRL